MSGLSFGGGKPSSDPEGGKDQPYMRVVDRRTLDAMPAVGSPDQIKGDVAVRSDIIATNGETSSRTGDVIDGNGSKVAEAEGENAGPQDTETPKPFGRNVVKRDARDKNKGFGW